MELSAMSEYGIWLCPFCREQIEREDYWDPAGHTHDGIDYPPVRVDVAWTVPLEELKAAVADAEEAHREAEARAEANRAELAAMEVEWRKTAPPEQIAAYDLSRARELNGLKNMAAVVREVWAGPEAQEQMRDYARESSATFFGSDEEKAEARRIRKENELRRLRDTIALFEAEGPRRVGFWKLRDTRAKLAELEADA